MFLSARLMIAAATSSGARAPPAQTASAAAMSKAAANTESRAISACSPGVHSEWLQSIAARSDWCRGAPDLRPPVSSRSLSSMCSAISCSGSARSRTVASSIASGTPSRRLQTVMMSGRFSGVTANPGTTAAARCANSSTASAVPARSESGAGTGSGRSWRTVSPDASSGCLLVARMVTAGASRKMASASSAHASIRCSQVSRMSSSSRSRR